MRLSTVFRFIATVLALVASSTKSEAQCDPSQKYDLIISCFHSSAAITQAGTWVVWGQDMRPDGTSDYLVPTQFNQTNYPLLRGTVRKIALGGGGSSAMQQFAALSDSGIYVWGNAGNIVSTTLKPTAAFGRMVTPTGADTTTKLPPGVRAINVNTFIASNGCLAILTDSGFVYVLNRFHQDYYGDSSTAINNAWHKVRINASTFLTGVTQLRMQISNATYGAFMAVTSGGAVYTWGRNVYLGNSAASLNRPYATQMTMPIEFTSSNLPKMIAVTGGTLNVTTTKNSYYALSNSGALYSLGNNDKRQLGDFTTTERTSWVNCQRVSGTNFTGVKTITAQEHCAAVPAIAVTTDTGDLYTWGDNDGLMIGRAVDAQAYDPGFPLGFTQGVDKAIFAEQGGHTLVYLKIGNSRFCYVGHKTAGSMADSVSASSNVSTFNCSNTGNVTLCGMVLVAGSRTNSTISASPTTINADGTSTTTITVQLKDSANVNLTSTGGTVTMSTTGGTLSAVTDNNNGTYTATLTSSTATGVRTVSFAIMGAPATNTATVNFAACNPVISTEPVNTTICSGLNGSMGLVSSGTGLSYQWQENSGGGFANLSNGGVYSGVTTATLTFTGATTGMNSRTYRCIVSNACIPNDTSATVTLTVPANPSVTNFSTSVASPICATSNATVTINSTSLAAGTYTVTYNLTGTNNAAAQTASITMASNTGTFTVPGAGLDTTGTTTVTITGIRNAAGCNTTVSTSNTANLTINARPIVTNFNTGTGGSICIGANGTVNVTSTTLTAGTYTITYNLTGANNAAAQTTSITMAANSGSFTIASAGLDTTGLNTVTITGITNASGCSTTVSSGNSAGFNLNPNPNVSSFSLLGISNTCVGLDRLATISSTSLLSGTYTVIYNLSGANNATGLTATTSISSNSGDFNIPSAQLDTAGTNTVTITAIRNSTNCTTSVSSGNVQNFNTVAYPVVSSFSSSVASPACANTAVTGTINSTTLIDGTYQVFYNLTGANNANNQSASITMASNTGTFTIPGAGLDTSGSTTVTITGIRTSPSNCLTSVSSGNVSVLVINPNPIVSSLGTSAANTCLSTAATVTLNSTTLAAGTYTVTYNLTGVNNAAAQTASITMASNTGTFTVPGAGLDTTGTTTVTITGIRTAAGCNTVVSSGNTANFSVTPNPGTIGGPTVIAYNGSGTLTNSVSGGTWSSSNTGVATIGSSSGSITGVAGGTTTISYVTPPSCATSTVVTVVAAIAGADTVRAGATTTYTDATAGGTWSSSTTGVASINSSTGLITGVAPGTATISYTFSGVSVTKVITVTPIAPIVGADSVVNGLTSTYTDATPGGTWSSSTTGVATINSSTGLLTTVATGTTTITYTVGSAFVTKVVTVVPIQPITGADTLIAGLTTTYADATPGGTWSSSTTGVATINPTTGLITGVAAGTSTITYTVGSQFVTKVITITPIAPIVGADSVVNGLLQPIPMLPQVAHGAAALQV